MRIRFIPVMAAALFLASFAPSMAADTATKPAGQHQGGPPPGGVDLRTACQADDEKVCPGVHAAHGDIVACLKKNIASVSAPCRAALEKMGDKPQGAPPQGGGKPPAPPTSN